jgi:TRAP-type C4-dicarboxylate transport system permease small subunit
MKLQAPTTSSSSRSSLKNHRRLNSIVIYYTYEQTWLAYDNFAIVGGTDDVMEWWFYTATPLAWSLIVIRVIQNLVRDVHTFRKREPFVLQASLLD